MKPERTNDKKILLQIRKLLALAGNNPNENERHAAAEKAQDLLAKYNLTMAQVREVVEDPRTMKAANFPFHEEWVRYVVIAAGRLYYTGVILSKLRRKCRPVFVGSPENTAVTLEISKWLVKMIRKEANLKYSQKIQRLSFCTGAADMFMVRVKEKLAAERFQARLGSKANELMVMRNSLEKANDQIIDEMNIEAAEPKERAPKDYNAYINGVMFAKNIGLEKQIGVRA